MIGADLKGKAALVTGSSRGIGAAVARGFGRCGMSVAVHCRTTRTEAEAVCADIRAAGGHAVLLQGDVAEASLVERLIAETVAAFGRIDVLVNNAADLLERRPVADTDDAAITYRRSDLETLELPDGKFDLVYSSLTFHYLHNLPSVLQTVERALVPGGIVAFSVVHPIFTAPSSAGFVRNGDGHWSWPVDQYLVEGPRTTDWSVDGVVKQHRTIGTYVTLLLQAGLVLAHLDEWGPTDEQIEQHPDWAIERERPPFLLMVGRKPGLVNSSRDGPHWASHDFARRSASAHRLRSIVGARSVRRMGSRECTPAVPPSGGSGDIACLG